MLEYQELICMLLVSECKHCQRMHRRLAQRILILEQRRVEQLRCLRTVKSQLEFVNKVISDIDDRGVSLDPENEIFLDNLGVKFSEEQKDEFVGFDNQAITTSSSFSGNNMENITETAKVSGKSIQKDFLDVKRKRTVRKRVRSQLRSDNLASVDRHGSIQPTGFEKGLAANANVLHSNYLSQEAAHITSASDETKKTKPSKANDTIASKKDESVQESLLINQQNQIIMNLKKSILSLESDYAELIKDNEQVRNNYKKVNSMLTDTEQELSKSNSNLKQIEAKNLELEALCHQLQVAEEKCKKELIARDHLCIDYVEKIQHLGDILERSSMRINDLETTTEKYLNIINNQVSQLKFSEKKYSNLNNSFLLHKQDSNLKIFNLTTDRNVWRNKCQSSNTELVRALKEKVRLSREFKILLSKNEQVLI